MSWEPHAHGPTPEDNLPEGWTRVPLDLVDLIEPGKIPAKPPFLPPIYLECPSCAAHVAGPGNNPKDLVLCCACRALLVLDATFTLIYLENTGEYGWALAPGDIRLRRPTDHEETEALKHPRVLAAIKTLADYHAAHGSPHPNLNPPDTGDPWGPPEAG